MGNLTWCPRTRENRVLLSFWNGSEKEHYREIRNPFHAIHRRKYFRVHSESRDPCKFYLLMCLETTEGQWSCFLFGWPILLHVPPNAPAHTCSIASSVHLVCSAQPGYILPLVSPSCAFLFPLLPTLLREWISFLHGALIAFHMKPLFCYLSHILLLSSWWIH